MAQKIINKHVYIALFIEADWNGSFTGWNIIWSFVPPTCIHTYTHTLTIFSWVQEATSTKSLLLKRPLLTKKKPRISARWSERIYNMTMSRKLVSLYLYITVDFFPFSCCETGCCRCRFVFPQSSAFRSQSFKALFTKFCKFRIISFLSRPLNHFRILELLLHLQII